MTLGTEKPKLRKLVDEAIVLIREEQKQIIEEIKSRLDFEIKYQPQFLHNETPASLAQHELKVETEKALRRLDLK